MMRDFIDPGGMLWGLIGHLTRCLHLDHQGEHAEEKTKYRQQGSTQTLHEHVNSPEPEILAVRRCVNIHTTLQPSI